VGDAVVGRSRLTRGAAAVALALAASACVSVQWQRERRYRPLDGQALEMLEPGTTELGAVLAAFGAPLVVREHKTYGVELAYGWSDTANWGVDVSVPIDQYASASFNYNQIGAELLGVVLLFDRDLELVTVRRGYLRELLAGDQGRPPSVPE
jgi:hypothetical protein